jgi:membrane carboxypeptidase/penicillin-binding protein
MLEDGKISKTEHEKAVKEQVKVYFREDFAEQAPHFAEVIRQILVDKLGEKAVLDEGIRVYTSLDPKFQKTAQEAVEKNLWDLSKRQGFKGAKSNLKTPEEIAQFLTKSRDEYYRDANPYRIITGTEKDTQLLPPLDLTKKPGAGNLPAYLKVGQRAEGVVTKIDSKFGLVTVRIAKDSLFSVKT